MITVEHIETAGWEPALRGMRNPLESWDRADSRFGGRTYEDEVPGIGEYAEYVEGPVLIGPNDESLMRRLIGQGSSDHCKFRRMLAIYCDVTAPLYWLKEWETYKVGTVSNSCSTMHTIMRDEFHMGMFSTDQMDDFAMEQFQPIIGALNDRRDWYITARNNERSLREKYRETGQSDCLEDADVYAARASEAWYELIQMLPSSWMQRRTVMLNYEVMANIYRSRRHHKLKEWRDFIDAMVENLPYPWIFTGEGC